MKSFDYWPRKDTKSRSRGPTKPPGRKIHSVLLCLLCLLWLLPSASAKDRALDTLTLLGEGSSRSLLKGKKPIFAETSGQVPVSFCHALKLLEQPDLMIHVQQAYCNLITEDGTPEFTIRQTSTNTYFYVNRKGERTDITEILRRQSSDGCFDIILYSAGKRFFGKYEAVIHVQVTADGKENTRYAASVYAYPENAVSRFFARRLGLVKRYFKKKTKSLTAMITTITCNLCEQEKKAAVTVAQVESSST